MKRMRFIALAAILCSAVTVGAKDMQTVVFKTKPEMHCNNCEVKIKNNLRFEKGVKDIVTNLADKTVTVTYDADKTTVENLVKGFAKIKYEATPVKDKDSQKTVCPEETQSPAVMKR